MERIDTEQIIKSLMRVINTENYSSPRWGAAVGSREVFVRM